MTNQIIKMAHLSRSSRAVLVESGLFDDSEASRNIRRQRDRLWPPTSELAARHLSDPSETRLGGQVVNSRPFAKARQGSSLPSVSLSVAKDVEVKDRSYLALTEEPWLRVDFNGPLPVGRWIRLAYSASMFDPLVRPLMRCFIGESHNDEILPGALFGRAVWLGLIPEGTEEIWISPTNRDGPFGFSLESIVTLSTAELIWRCMRKNPGRCLKGLGARLVGLRYSANVEFRRVLSATRLKDYDAWRKHRLRDLDRTNLEVPRTNWEDGPHIRFVTFMQPGSSASVQALVSDLSAQPYPHWTLAIFSQSGIDELAGLNVGDHKARIIAAGPGATVYEVLEGLSDTDFIAPISVGDRIPAYAVAVLAETANQNLATEMFYGDQELIGSDGRHQALWLRPDWSPAFSAASPYMSGAEFFKVKMLRQFASDMSAVDLVGMPSKVLNRVLRQQPSVIHIRRVMRTRSGGPSIGGTIQSMLSLESIRSSAECAVAPSVTIIIPTKDRVGLLKCCVESLSGKTSIQNIEVIIVDNGSVQDDTRRFFAELTNDKRYRVLSRPGRFNFSGLCNDAAAEAKAATLVFLNNDTEVIQEHWLEPLLYWSQQADVGAVGAKLLYPNGHVQHAGVILGVDGRGGHFERMLGKNDPGYFGRLCVPHEVSAVTAACLAVDKHKFDAVGGFDAMNLPIEFNDLDLCLRLSEQGWKSVCAPDAVLIHHESASRGTTARPDEVYREEHRYFRARWMHRLRDDPYFHPALSLDRLDAALG
jgi:GT2 family glycosyltransferase